MATTADTTAQQNDAPAKYRLSDADIRQRLEFIGCSEADAQLLYPFLSWAEAIVKSIATEFHEQSIWNAGFTEIVRRNSSNQSVLEPAQNIGDPSDELHYFAFDGSLAAPPCSERVKWYMMQETELASKAQMDKFMSIFGGNARPVQPLNGRPVGEF